MMNKINNYFHKTPLMFFLMLLLYFYYSIHKVNNFIVKSLMKTDVGLLQVSALTGIYFPLITKLCVWKVFMISRIISMAKKKKKNEVG